MRLAHVASCLACLCATGALRAAEPPTGSPAPPELGLRGDRFRPLTWPELDPAQRALVEHLLAGARGGLTGPFNVLLRSPETGDLTQKLGEQLRYHSSLPRRLTEFAIMIAARAWNSSYEWYAHYVNAREAGVTAAVLADVRDGRRPRAMQADEAVVYGFVTELLAAKQVGDATFATAKTALGEQGVVDLIALVGYYQMVAMLLNVDRYPLPPGAGTGADAERLLGGAR